MPSFYSEISKITDIEDIVEEKRNVFYEEKTSNVLEQNSIPIDDVKIEVKDTDKKQSLQKNIGFLCNILQMLPAGNMVCKISLATSFTVMFMWNMELITLKWGCNFR